MLALYIIVVILVCGLVFFNAYKVWSQRLKSPLPSKTKSTMFDVRRLLMDGKKDTAIQVYCEIFQTTPDKAKKDIDQLQRSLKV
ncbi:MAG: hypothetical protein HQL13_03955 [Candidatus Omnitrophica bacterium]|nr:hypothetical protein [Candidatus Omnitrophota bacterium]